MCKILNNIGDIAKQIPTPRLQGSVNIMRALDVMDLCETHIVAVECEDEFVGVFRRSDFNKCVTRQNLNPREASLYEVMSVNIPSIDPATTIREAYDKMMANKWDFVTVLTSRRLHGIVPFKSLGKDVMQAYEDLRAENRMIMSYIQRGESYGLSDYNA